MVKAYLTEATLIGGVAAALLAGAAVPSQAAEGRNAPAIAGAVGGLAVGSAIASGASEDRSVRVVRERRVIVEDEDDAQECVVRTRRVLVSGVYRTRQVRVCE